MRGVSRNQAFTSWCSASFEVVPEGRNMIVEAGM
jgi:hypothetical protein